MTDSTQARLPPAAVPLNSVNPDTSPHSITADFLGNKREPITDHRPLPKRGFQAFPIGNQKQHSNKHKYS